MFPWLTISLFLLLYTGYAPSDKFYADHLENIYFIEGHKIIKIEIASGQMLEYGSLSAGMITSVDVTNPFQILIFYRDFNQVVFLDNKLARLRSVLSLSDMGIEQALLSCSSGRGGFWVFSDRDNRAVYFDQQLRNSHQSNIISVITGSNIKPVYMTEVQNNLYLHVPGKGILVFDRFAVYMKTIPYSGPERFQVADGKIVYFKEGELLSLDIDKGETASLDLPPGLKIDYSHLQSQRLYIISGKRVLLFTIQ